MTRLGRRLGELYDDYRTVLLSKKYYSYRLSSVKRLNLICETLLALAASSAFASAQVFHQYAFVQKVAPWGAGAVALLAVIKPLLGYDKDIERLTRLVTHYAETFEQMRRLIAEIYIEQEMSGAQEWQLQNLQSSMIKLSASEDLTFHRKKLEKLQAEVHQELPSASFWYPERDGACPIPAVLDATSPIEKEQFGAMPATTKPTLIQVGS